MIQVPPQIIEYWKIFKPLLEDRLTIVFFACAINYFLLRRNLIISIPVPGNAIGKLAATLDQKLNRDRRSPAALSFRGMIITVIFCLAGYQAGVFIHNASLDFEYGWVVDATMLAAVIYWRLTFDTLDDLVWKNTDMSLYEDRNMLTPLSDFDHSVLDLPGVFRQGMESASEELCESFITGIMIYLLTGLPGLLFYYALLKIVEIVGHPHERWRNFGLFPMLLFDVCNFIPAMLTSVLLIAAAIFTGGGHPLRGALSMAHLRSNGVKLMPVHIAASAAGVQLGGNKKRRDLVISYPWVGIGTPKPTENHARIFIRLFQVSSLIFLALLGLVYINLN